MTIGKPEIYEFIRRRGSAVVGSVAETGAPQSARVYVTVTPDLELLFYTLQTNRKCLNLRRDPRIAVSIGWDSEQTLQYEGIALEIHEQDMEGARQAFREAHPEHARNANWPGLTFFRVRPTWLRFSSYTPPWRVEEMTFPENRSKGPHSGNRRSLFGGLKR